MISRTTHQFSGTPNILFVAPRHALATLDQENPMTLAIVYCRAQAGMSAPLVTVETHISRGNPGLAIVGLPETAVKESKDRVRSALSVYKIMNLLVNSDCQVNCDRLKGVYRLH